MKKPEFVLKRVEGGMALLYSLATKKHIFLDEVLYEKILHNNVNHLSLNEKIVCNDLLLKNFLYDDAFDENEYIKSFLREKLEKEKALKFLTFIVIPTYNCNCLCKYCYQKNRENECTMTNDVIIQTARFICRQAEKYEVENVSIQWMGGEVTEEREVFFSALDGIKNELDKKSIHLTNTVFSNFIDMHISDIELLIKKYNTRLFSISLDGDEEYHNQYRLHKTHKNSFKMAVDNLLNAKAIFKKHNIILNICSVVSYKNEESYEHLVKLIKYLDKEKVFELDNYQVTISIQRPIIQGELDVDYDFNKDRILLDHIRKLEDFAKRNRYNIVFAIEWNKKGYCRACSGQEFVIDPNGDVFCCPVSVKIPEMRIGNVREKLDEEIMNNILMGNVYEFEKRIDESECRYCPYKIICSGGCKMLSYYKNGTLKDVLCEKKLLQEYFKENLVSIFEREGI